MAWISAGSIGVPLIGKFSTARWVCARHRASRGTWTSPMRVVLDAELLITHGSNVPTDPGETALPLGPAVGDARRMDVVEQLWPPFALRVTCGPLVMRLLRDADFPEVLAVAHAGIHDPDLLPFYLPWTEPKGADMERAVHAVPLASACQPLARRWSARPGRLGRGALVGVQGVSTHDFPGDPHRRDRLVARPAVPRAADRDADAAGDVRPVLRPPGVRGGHVGCLR